MPDHEVIKRQKALRIFGNLLYNPNLWCLNRRSASGAFALGLFMAFVPLPSQMIMSAGMAIALGVNLPLAVALVWVSNPITMPIMFYFCYKVGAVILRTPSQHFHFEVSWDFIVNQMSTIGPPFLLGCLVCGVVCASIGYFGIRGLWRYSVVRSWQQRKSR
ncbi:ATP-binding protein [Vibrio sp. MACH09]|nr:ATP-binding protein [Vibrio sp. MACH09]